MRALPNDQDCVVCEDWHVFGCLASSLAKAFAAAGQHSSSLSKLFFLYRTIAVGDLGFRVLISRFFFFGLEFVLFIMCFVQGNLLWMCLQPAGARNALGWFFQG